MQTSRNVTQGREFELPRLCRYFSEQSPLPMIAVEGTTHVVRYLNDAFVQLVGKERDALLGRPFAEAVPEGIDNGCAALLGEVYQTGTPMTLCEQHHIEKSLSYWSYSAWPILGQDNRPAGVLVHVSDVTDATLFRAQVVEMNQTLVVSSVRQHELVDIAEQLNVRLKDSEEKSRQLFETAQGQALALVDLHSRKDEFLAMLGHELRNPLASIVNAMQLLRLETNDPVIQQQASLIIERQSTQLTRLVDDLLEVSRMSTGKLQLRLEAVLMSDVVERAVESAQPLINLHRHELAVSLPPEPVWLRADAARLEQVIVNLLSNSAKYTADGGKIWLSIKLGTTDDALAGEVLLCVRDNGVGISPGLLPHVFDLFTQGAQSLDRSHGGLGIGLALVHHLVQLHQGTVEAHSSAGQGSEFVVRLPVMASPASSATMNTVASKAPGDTGLRVLVVDDNIDAATSLAMLVRANGYDVRTAFTGRAAVATAIDFEPHVVLLDIGLPDLDGLQAAKQIRQQLVLNHVVLVAMTGYGQIEDYQRSMKAGFDYHLVKPADFRQVQEILTTVKVH